MRDFPIRRLRQLIAVGAAICATSVGAVEEAPQNSSCPQEPNWSDNRTMELTPVERDGQQVLLAEGWVDEGLPGRLQHVLGENPGVSEIWFRSSGGDALAGNDAGLLLRAIAPGMVTRIPAGWTCAGACNFVFMGGQHRYVDPDGVFMVRMFTRSGDQSVRENVARGGETATRTIDDIEGSTRSQATADVDFVTRLGISRRLLNVMYEASALGDGENRRCLTQDELVQFSVTNMRE